MAVLPTIPPRRLLALTAKSEYRHQSWHNRMWGAKALAAAGKPAEAIRAARDFAVERPEFALAAGMTALRGIADGWGYDITGVDVLDAYAAVMAEAGAAGLDEAVVMAEVRALIAANSGGASFLGGCWRCSWRNNCLALFC